MERIKDITVTELLKLNISDVNNIYKQDLFEQIEKVDREQLLLSIIHDAQSKIEMEQKIGIQESYFKSLFENSPEAIAVLDNEFRIVNVNDSFINIFQYTLEEINYKNISKVIYEEKLNDEYTNLKDCIKNGEFVRMEIQQKRKDGKLLDISFLGFPILSNGKQVGVYCIYTDITKNKIYEKELKNAKYKAEEASKFKTKFIANIAHEIRTPVNGIVGIIDLLQQNQLSNENKKCFHMLRYSAERLSIIINDVMDMTKIEAGKLYLKEERFHIKKLLNDVEKYFSIQAGKKKLGFKLNLDSSLPNILSGDSDKLIQVLFNLLSNAIKFTDQGSIHVDVTVDKSYDEEVKVKFSVQDTGIGIPKEQIGHIFDDFFQLDSADIRKCGGAGLGLTISKNLVQLMGGKLEAKSEYGKGSTFYFKVKFKILKNQKKDIKNVISKKTDEFFEVNPPLKICVIEDESINHYIIKSFLEKKKCIVTIANNGREALQLLDKQTFDVILMDIYMPEVDGFELAKLIRQIEKLQGRYTPIIAVTASIMNEDIDIYYNLGIDDYIAKPFKKEQLYSAISRVVSKHNKNRFYNLKPLLVAIDGDKKLLDHIINEFTGIKYQEELFNNIEKFARESDLEALTKYLHKFKGSISHFQVASINNILRELKENCKNKNIVSLNQSLKRLKNEYIDLKNFLIKYAKKPEC